MLRRPFFRARRRETLPCKDRASRNGLERSISRSGARPFLFAQKGPKDAPKPLRFWNPAPVFPQSPRKPDRRTGPNVSASFALPRLSAILRLPRALASAPPQGANRSVSAPPRAGFQRRFALRAAPHPGRVSKGRAEALPLVGQERGFSRRGPNRKGPLLERVFAYFLHEQKVRRAHRRETLPLATTERAKMGNKEYFALRREALSVRAERAERRAKTSSVLESRHRSPQRPPQAGPAHRPERFCLLCAAAPFHNPPSAPRSCSRASAGCSLRLFCAAASAHPAVLTPGWGSKGSLFSRPHPTPGGFPKGGTRPSLWSVRRKDFQGEDPIERVLSLNALFAAFPALEKRLAATAAKLPPRARRRETFPAAACQALGSFKGAFRASLPIGSKAPSARKTPLFTILLHWYVLTSPPHGGTLRLALRKVEC